MDAFFASVEQRDNPEYRGKPIAVGGGGNRGVVAAASYEARKYGVFSAMPSRTAIQKCPNLIFIKPRFDAYKTTSLVIRSIFKEYTDLVEPLSLDEAYLDVTINKKGMRSATLIAEEIRSRIKEHSSLTASAGVSINKFLAKVASDINKPDGIYVIPPSKVQAFINGLSIEKFYGVGKVTADKMKLLGISTGEDLAKLSRSYLIKHFGKAGGYSYDVARGQDNRLVEPDRERKSLGAENTFSEDYSDVQILHEELTKISELVFRRVQKARIKGKTITLKIKFADFKQITRSKTFHKEISGYDDILRESKNLFDDTFHPSMKIRLLGVTLSNFNEESKESSNQITLDF